MRHTANGLLAAFPQVAVRSQAAVAAGFAIIKGGLHHRPAHSTSSEEGVWRAMWEASGSSLLLLCQPPSASHLPRTWWGGVDLCRPREEEEGLAFS
jgi:hypothetical protein